MQHSLFLRGDVSVLIFKVRMASVKSSHQVGQMTEMENRKGINKIISFEPFNTFIHGTRERLQKEISASLARGKTVVGYGASVGTTTLEYIFWFVGAKIAYVVDDNPDRFRAVYSRASSSSIFFRCSFLRRNLMLLWFLHGGILILYSKDMPGFCETGRENPGVPSGNGKSISVRVNNLRIKKNTPGIVTGIG